MSISTAFHCSLIAASMLGAFHACSHKIIEVHATANCGMLSVNYVVYVGEQRAVRLVVHEGVCLFLLVHRKSCLCLMTQAIRMHQHRSSSHVECGEPA